MEARVNEVVAQSKKALECLLPEARKKNEEKEIKELLADTKINKEVKKVAEEERKMFHNAAKLFELMKDKLDTYQKEKATLPKQSDGLYILLQGNANIVNQHDGAVLKKLEPYDGFGIGRFLSCTGYSFFGDLVAEGKPGDKIICLFVPKEAFHRIPFFDWYKVREATYKMKTIDRLVSESREKYWTTVLRFRQLQKTGR